jgi:hypothetical protein
MSASMSIHSSFQNCYASSRSISLAVLIAPQSAFDQRQLNAIRDRGSTFSSHLSRFFAKNKPEDGYDTHARNEMAHPDIEALFDSLLQFTKELLSKQVGFNPWAATMSSTGAIQWVGADNGEEFPEAQALIDLLNETFQRQSTPGVLRAIGICYDARVVPPGQSDKSDAICCSLEHISGEALDIFVPYTKAADGIHYAEMFTLLRNPRFFLPAGTQ